MTMLQHGLQDSEMELVFSCMDSHGYITAEQVGRLQHVCRVLCNSLLQVSCTDCCTHAAMCCS